MWHPLFIYDDDSAEEEAINVYILCMTMCAFSSVPSYGVFWVRNKIVASSVSIMLKSQQLILQLISPKFGNSHQNNVDCSLPLFVLIIIL